MEGQKHSKRPRLKELTQQQLRSIWAKELGKNPKAMGKSPAKHQRKFASNAESFGNIV